MTMRRIWWSATAVAIVVELSGCGSSPIAPPPPPASLSLTCPATATVQSVDGNATNVSFDQPQAAGGTRAGDDHLLGAVGQLVRRR